MSIRSLASLLLLVLVSGCGDDGPASAGDPDDAGQADAAPVVDATTSTPDGEGSDVAGDPPGEPDASGRVPLSSGDGWVRIEPGTFVLGSPGGELGRTNVERQSRVTLTRPFEIMTTEVTRGMWQNLMGDHRSSQPHCGPSCPVDNVSWWGAVAFANARSVVSGLAECHALSGCTEGPWFDKCEWVTVTAVDGNPYACEGFRLPTEAEWEYAARAGDIRATYNGDLTSAGCWDSTLVPIAWFCGNSGNWLQPVAQKRPNAWGLYDMLGNASEWMWGRPDATYGAVETDPLGGTTQYYRAVRGGSSRDQAKSLRAAWSDRDTPSYGSHYLGFRLVRTLPPSSTP